MNGENRDKMNIMYIFNDTAFGGAGQSLLDTLVEIKYKINPIVIIRDRAKVEEKFTDLGIKCYKIPFSTDYVKIGSADAEKRMRDFRQSYEAAMQLLPIIEEEKVSLIHINSSVSYFAAIAALIANIPYIWHIRELMRDLYGCEFLNEDLKLSLYKKASRLITISDFVQRRYYEEYGLETFRLYNGLNTQRYQAEIDVNKPFKNAFIVAAMIMPEKRQWDVIRATELLAERGHDDINVIIVGNGGAGYVWALKKYIHKKNLDKNIVVLPFQNDLSNLRSQVSYAITSSQNEALGRVTIEAMLAGHVVIGARSGGTQEIIGSNEERGFLYELGNVYSLADTMERAISCEDDIKNTLLLNAQAYVEDTFNSKGYCRELLKIYDEEVKSFIPFDHTEFIRTLSEYYDMVRHGEEPVKEDNNITISNKSALMFSVALKWLEIRQKGHSLDEYFVHNNIHVIAIYGIGELGRRLYDELENTDIEIETLIDRNPNGMEKVLKFSQLNEEKLDVDAIVVTVISSEDQIIEEIKAYGYENVIGLSEIINSFEEGKKCM